MNEELIEYLKAYHKSEQVASNYWDLFAEHDQHLGRECGQEQSEAV